MLSYWLNKPPEYEIGDKKILIHAPGKTDYFEDPLSDLSISNAPFHYMKITGNFTFTCKITPRFQQTYDAGALFYYCGPARWVKFAFEKTDLGYTSVVCVVTKNKSDDSNGEKITTGSIGLRMSRKNNVIGTYFQTGNSGWKMARLFPFKSTRNDLLGIIAQSPLGNGCPVLFEEIDFDPHSIKDFRKGV